MRLIRNANGVTRNDHLQIKDSLLGSARGGF
jgi:hypothetical protein